MATVDDPPAGDPVAARARIQERSHEQALALERLAALGQEVRRRGRTIQEAARDAEGAAHEAARTAETQSSVLDDLAQSLEALRSLGTEVAATRKLVEQVRRRLGQIQQVAEDCRMLSLNASIEAVRAGAAGQSFGVVAESMRDLAESSRAQADEIQALVTETVDRMKALGSHTQSAADVGTERIEHVERALTEIRAGLSASAGAMSRTSTEVVAQGRLTDALASEMQDVAESNSQETAEVLSLLDGVEIDEILPAEAGQRLREFVVIDVRTRHEFDGELGRVAGARLLPIREDFRGQLAGLPEDANLLFVCRSGGRSMRACRVALTLGHRRITNLRGGMLAWAEAGLPVEHGS